MEAFKAVTGTSRSHAVPTHSFTLLLAGPDPTEPRLFAALEARGCDDALFGMTGGVAFADFDREEVNMGDAVLSAIHDVETAVPELLTLRVEPEELVTASGIAARVGRTRESVRLWIEGKRGPGGFPPPVARLEGRTRVWKWTEVARWLGPAVGQTPSTDGEMLAAINAWLEIRRFGGALAGSERRRDFADLIRDELERLSA